MNIGVFLADAKPIFITMQIDQELWHPYCILVATITLSYQLVKVESLKDLL
jgi:hypothetical protein